MTMDVLSNLRKFFTYDQETGEFTRTHKLSWTGARYQCEPRSDWGKSAYGYPQVNIAGRPHAVHRLIYLWMTGRMPKEIDHINGNRADNRWCNLREVTRLTNRKNSALRSDNTTGIHGVSNTGVSFVTYIEVNGVRVRLGNTPDFFEACCRRKAAESRFGFHENHGRVA